MEEADSKSEAKQQEPAEEGWFRWFTKLFWGHVLYPMAKGIVFGIGSKLGAILVRYLFMRFFVDYREFATPEQLKAERLAFAEAAGES